jgi:hypothetical protein
MSRYRILYYKNDREYCINFLNENPDLTRDLWKYYENLGVEAYQADTDDLNATVKWELQGKWYNTSQIERIMNLRAFL